MRSRICWLAIIAPALLSAQTVEAQPVPMWLTLEEAVKVALQQSPDLRIARAEVDAAKAETRGARSRLQPQVAINGFGTTGTMQSIVTTPAGVDPSSAILVPERQFLDLNLGLMLPIYTGGTLGSLVGAAVAREQAARSTATGMQSDVALMVRDAYLKTLLAGEIAVAQESRVKAAEEMVRNAQALFETGKGIQATVQRAQAELADAQRELTMTRNDQAKMVLELKSTMGLKPGTEIVLADTLSYIPPAGGLDDYLKQAGSQRGELLAARQEVRAAESQASAARGAVKPQIYGFGMADAFKATGSEMGGSGSGYTLGLSVSFPLYDAGMRRSEIARMNAMLERAKGNAQKWELRTDREVRQAWLDVQTANKNRESATSGLEAARAAYEVATLRVQSGKGILVEQLDALAALIRAQANLAQATYDHQIAVARLTRAAGGI